MEIFFYFIESHFNKLFIIMIPFHLVHVLFLISHPKISKFEELFVFIFLIVEMGNKTSHLVVKGRIL